MKVKTGVKAGVDDCWKGPNLTPGDCDPTNHTG